MVTTFMDGFPQLDDALILYDFNPLDPIGKGNNFVFEATRRMDGKKLALKQYLYNENDDTDKCRNEISLLESIKHENIV